jgi:MFS family permease
LVNLQLAAFDWRWLFVVGILPAFITILIRMRVREPETWVRQHESRVKEGHRGPLGELFRVDRWRRRALVACLLGIVGIAGAWNTSFWLPNLVKEVSLEVTAEVVRARVSYATMTLHIGTLLGVLVFPQLCVRFGRRPAFAVFFLCSPLAVALAAFGAGSFKALLLCGPVMAFFTIGLSSGYALYFPELFPTRLRATGAGFCYNTGRVLSAPFPALAGALIGAFGGHVGAGVAASALIYFPGLIAVALAPETRGQPLPEE